MRKQWQWRKNQGRNEEIVAMIRAGEHIDKVAGRFGLSLGQVYLIAREAKVKPCAPRKQRTDNEYLNWRDAEIVKLDDGNRTLEAIGDKFGLTKERVRQILVTRSRLAHGIKRAEKAERRALDAKAARARARTERDAKRMVVGQQVAEVARYYKLGFSDKEIAAALGMHKPTLQTSIAGRWRKRWPHLFLYRRSWSGHRDY